MKVLTLVSSYRVNGNTVKVVQLLEDALRSENQQIEIERINIGHLNICMCRGCRVCFDRGEANCPLKDSVSIVAEKIAKADGLIVASPVYVEDVNGIMKNWIDRMAYNCHRPAFAGKSALVLTTSGVGSSGHAVKTIQTALNTWGIKVVGKHRFRTGAFMDYSNFVRQYNNTVHKLARQLINAMAGGEHDNPSFYSLIVFKVQQQYWQKTKKYIGTLDYQYWAEKGWLKPTCSYYLPCGSNFIKVKFARLIGCIVALFFV